MSMKLEWKETEAIMAVSRRIILSGPPGTGKTTTPILMAIKNKWPFFVVTLTDDTSVQECVGHWFPKGGGNFVWHNGPFALAWGAGEHKDGGLLVINEITRASGAVQTEMYNFLDDPDTAVKTLPSGQVIRPGKNFRCVATTNDPFDMLPEALQDRFEGKIQVTKPHPKALEKLPENYRKFISACYSNKNNTITYRQVYSFWDFVANKGVPERIAAAAVFDNRGDEVISALSLGERK